MTQNEELLVVQLAGEDPRDSLVLAAAAAFSGLGCDGEPLGKPEAIEDLEDRNGELDEDDPSQEWADPRRSVRRFAIETGLNWESTKKAIQRLRKRNLLADDGQVRANDLRARNGTQGRIWLKYSRELRTYGMPYRAKALVAWLLNRKAQSLGPQTTALSNPQLARIMGWTERQVDVALTKAKVEGWVQRRRVGNLWHTTAGRFTFGDGDGEGSGASATNSDDKGGTMNQNTELVRQLLALLTTTPTDSSARRYVIVRGSQSGVHAGYLESQSGSVVRLSKSRRLWLWRVPMGAPSFLSGVATHGIDHENSKVGTLIDLTITDACEVIDVSEAARKSIESAPEVERNQ